MLVCVSLINARTCVHVSVCVGMCCCVCVCGCACVCVHVRTRCARVRACVRVVLRIWGGGWLGQRGVLDFAGGIIIHTMAGASSIVVALSACVRACVCVCVRC